jgi:hypothetical protein
MTVTDTMTANWHDRGLTLTEGIGHPFAKNLFENSSLLEL